MGKCNLIGHIFDRFFLSESFRSNSLIYFISDDFQFCCSFKLVTSSWKRRKAAHNPMDFLLLPSLISKIFVIVMRLLVFTQDVCSPSTKTIVHGPQTKTRTSATTIRMGTRDSKIQDGEVVNSLSIRRNRLEKFKCAKIDDISKS